MPYVMIAVFDIKNLPDVIFEFVSRGIIESVEPAYVKGDIPETMQRLKNVRATTGKDRAIIMDYIREKRRCWI